MTVLRPILVWLALLGLLAPGVAGRVLCVESDGRITIEAMADSAQCATECASRGDAGTTAGSSATPHECSDIALTNSVRSASRTATGLVDIDVLQTFAADMGARMQSASVVQVVAPASHLDARHRTVQSVVLRL